MTGAKPPFANDETSHADGPAWQLALREMRAFIWRSKFWTIIGGASVTAALAGPFYTLERLSFPARLIYWSFIAIASGILMTFLSMLMRRIASQYGMHWLPTALIAGALGVLPTMVVIFVANLLSGRDLGPPEFWGLFPYVSVPLVLITVLVKAMIKDPEPPAPAAEQPTEMSTEGSTEQPAQVFTELSTEVPPTETLEQPALLFSKLPATLGREIVSLQAKDHYIEVTTPLGSALVLMRLTDAEQDLTTLPGMRVHRSWWVSLPHVERIEKGASGPELRMTTGQIIPVARGQRASVRDALAQR